MKSQTNRPFLRSLYPVGVLIILSSLIDPLLRVWPMQMGEVRWRFGAVGFFSSSVLGVMFGLVWMMVIALMLDHARTMRVLASFAIATGVIVAAVLVFFALDALQVRNLVNPQLTNSFDATVIKTAGILAISIPIAIWVGMGAWRTSKGVGATAKQSGRATKDEAGLLLHPQHKEATHRVRSAVP